MQEPLWFDYYSFIVSSEMGSVNLPTLFFFLKVVSILWVLLLLLLLLSRFSHVQLCDPIDSTVLGILQARTLEWVAISFSNA